MCDIFLKKNYPPVVKVEKQIIKHGNVILGSVGDSVVVWRILILKRMITSEMLCGLYKQYKPTKKFLSKHVN